jgi:hypothetical protein
MIRARKCGWLPARTDAPHNPPPSTLQCRSGPSWTTGLPRCCLPSHLGSPLQ